MAQSVTGLEKAELEAFFEERGERSFRAGQVLEWVYEKRVTGFVEMTNLGRGLREGLAGRQFR